MGLMEVQYQCTRADFLEVARHQKKSFLYYYVYWILRIFFLLAGALTAATGGRSHATDMFVIAGILLAWPLLVYPLSIRRNFRKLQNFSLRQTLIADEGGFQTHSDLGKSVNKWSTYSKFQETPNLFVLWIGQEMMFEAIPKRSFSAAELDEFRDLLVLHVPSR